MPNDMAKNPTFREAVRLLEEEVETWESFTGMQQTLPPVSAPLPKGRSILPGQPGDIQNGGPADGASKTRSNQDGEGKAAKKRSSKISKKKGGSAAIEESDMTSQMASI
jgi:hypothetical protein